MLSVSVSFSSIHCHWCFMWSIDVSCKILKSCSFLRPKAFSEFNANNFLLPQGIDVLLKASQKLLCKVWNILLSHRKMLAPCFCLLLVCDVGQFCTNEGLMFPTLIHQGFGGQKQELQKKHRDLQTEIGKLLFGTIQLSAKHLIQLEHPYLKRFSSLKV